MKIPESIKVGGHTYSIVFTDQLWMREGNLGQARHNMEQLIQLEPNLHPEQVNVSFWHEVLHVVDRVYNNNQLGESSVDCISEGLFQVLSGMGITFEK